MKNNPIKTSLKTEALPIAIIVISWIASAYFFLHFPDRVPTHWGINGEINGWSGKAFGAFFLPALNTCLYLMFLALPYIDPKKENYKKFAPAYHVFKNVILVILFAIYLMSGFAGLGYRIDMGLWVPVLIGIMFAVMGFSMEKLKLNWLIGFRNMWTLSSENVWNKTNKLAGKVMILSGVLIALTGFIPPHFILPVFVLAILLIIFLPNIASYIWYRQETNKK